MSFRFMRLFTRGSRSIGISQSPLVVGLLVASCASPTGERDEQHAQAAEGDHEVAVVLVQDVEGNPLQGATVHFKPAGPWGYAGLPVLTGVGGRASSRDSACPDWGAGYDVVISSRGHRSAMLRWFVGEATLRLPRSVPTTIRVRVAPESVAPAPPHQLFIVLEWLAPDGDADPRSFEAALSPSPPGEQPGIVEFVVDDPGTYIVSAMARIRMGELAPEARNPNALLERGLATTPALLEITIDHDQRNRTEEVELLIDGMRSDERR